MFYLADLENGKANVQITEGLFELKVQHKPMIAVVGAVK